MNFNEFLAHAKKVNGVPLDTLAKEVGAHMVLYPESGLKVIEKALAPIESPEVIRWDLLSTCLNEGDALDMAVVNGLDIDDKFREYFDFEEYWHNNGGETITTSYGVYMVDTKGLAYWLKELAAY